ncbi:MAG: MarR family winged helix-turn-helix transcriptional regulator [Christensenellales bacterium]
MNVNNTAGGMIKMINEALERDANNNLRSAGITMSQITVLLMLNQSAEGTLTLKEVEKGLHCAQSTAHGLITRLEEKGFVMSAGDPDDKRIRVISITEKGINCCREAESQMKETEERILKPLSPAEQEQFLTCLSKVKKALT